MKMVEVQKKYGDKAVINNQSFQFNNENIVGLIGKNGEGKTTLMKILNGNIVNYSGEVLKNSDDDIGFLIEHPKLYDNRNGRYNLNTIRNAMGVKKDEEYEDYLISKFGMRDYINKKVDKYSLGMKQKLAIAIALINKPDYLILDEPTNGMDPDGSVAVLKTIQEIVKKYNVKVLISSHKLEDIEMICERALFLHEGQFIKDIDINDQKNKVNTIVHFQEDELQIAYELLQSRGYTVEVDETESFINITGDVKQKEIIQLLSNNNLVPTNIESMRKSLRDTYFDLNNEEVK